MSKLAFKVVGDERPTRAAHLFAVPQPTPAGLFRRLAEQGSIFVADPLDEHLAHSSDAVTRMRARSAEAEVRIAGLRRRAARRAMIERVAVAALALAGGIAVVWALTALMNIAPVQLW